MKRTPRLNKVHHIDSIQDMLIKSANRHGDKLALEDLRDTPIPKASYNSLLNMC